MSHGPGRIPKDLLHGELAEGSRPIGRPGLRYKNTCKLEMKLRDIDVNKCESYAVREGVMAAEASRRAEQEDKRMR